PVGARQLREPTPVPIACERAEIRESLRDQQSQIGERAEHLLHVGGYARLAGSRKPTLRARRDDLVEHERENARLVVGKTAGVRIVVHQSKRFARFFFIVSAMYNARAWMVFVGFTAAAVTKMLPSTMNRFGTSCERPHSFTTDVVGSVPMRAVPMRCHPANGSGACATLSVAPAAASTSLPRATQCSSIFALFSLSA